MWHWIDISKIESSCTVLLQFLTFAVAASNLSGFKLYTVCSCIFFREWHYVVLVTISISFIALDRPLALNDTLSRLAFHTIFYPKLVSFLNFVAHIAVICSNAHNNDKCVIPRFSSYQSLDNFTFVCLSAISVFTCVPVVSTTHRSFVFKPFFIRSSSLKQQHHFLVMLEELQLL